MIPVPRYEQVKRHIMDAIEAGSYDAGDKLPSENELVRELNVSRMTVNRALRELTEEGHIVRRAGMGSFVADRRMRGHAADILSIRGELEARGEEWSAVVLFQEEIALPKDVAEEMGRTTGDKVFYLLIVHKGDDMPIELEERWVNPEIAPELLSQDFEATTPTDYLLAVAPLLRAEHVVRAVAATPSEKRLLEVREGSPCLEINRRTWTGDRVASYARLLYPGDRYELTARFSPVGASSTA
ncbi:MULTISPECIES: histidine utilization repressor [Kordiimonas]|jgi:GntR family histidine utilization transcriptional repressor|uniref:histidine utilization repressor n=1 Tax=Kordiimonas TaxID=288021 RepID=UPI0025810C1A|nr:histidine utilization repressor [Kordiimonas sp. UBA4487]